MAFFIGLFKCSFIALAILVIYQVIRLYLAGQNRRHDTDES